MLEKVGVILAAVCLLVSAAFAQGGRSEVSVGGTFNLSSNTTFTQLPSGLQHGLQITQASGRAGGFLASYRYGFARMHAVEVNYGYVRNTQNFTFLDTTELTQSSVGIQTSIHEATAAYVFRPGKWWKVNPFLLAGGGGLFFRPSSVSIYGPASQTKSAFLYGIGADLNVLPHKIGLRVQYRGLLYRAPDFDLTGFSTGGRAHLKQIGAGFVYHF